MKKVRMSVVCLVLAVSSLAGCATTAGAVLGGTAGHKYGGDATSTRTVVTASQRPARTSSREFDANATRNHAHMTQAAYVNENCAG